MNYLPIFIDLKDHSCWIIGGGAVAARKASLLIKAGAEVHVIAPKLSQELQRYLSEGKVRWHRASFSPEAVAELPRPLLIISATDDEAVSHQAAQWARERNILINTADVTELCDFILPAIIERAPVTVAVSTGGASPILARWIKGVLERCLPQGIGVVAQLLGNTREQVKAALPTPETRKTFWERLLTPKFIEKAQKNPENARFEILQKLDFEKKGETLSQGEVYLIGCGPGDPELLTLKAHRLLQQADILFYDRLVDSRILDLARREAEQMYVGKHAGGHTYTQEEINQLLIDAAKSGKKVARLKGGDPYIFGRGGEEVEALMTAGVEFLVVPGITTAAGAAALYGMPLTHRDMAQAVTFITGHSREGGLPYNWVSLAQPNHTLVIYMGLKNLPMIRAQLLDNGLDPATPVALIENATRPHAQVVTTTLSDCVEARDQYALKPPTLIVIGRVVQLHRALAS